MSFKSWKNISVSTKLYAVIGFMAFLIAIELFSLLFAMNTLSSVRSFVTGESLWSKSQKDAVISLHKYARTQDVHFYQSFQDYLKIPAGYHRSRLALEQNPPDVEAARQGFIAGRVHPDDVPGLIHVLLKFQNFYYLKKAVTIWREGDQLTQELVRLAEQLHHSIQANPKSPEVVGKLNAIDNLNDRLTVLEGEFSYTLGEGSRWLERALMLTLIFAVLLVEGTGLFLTINFGRSLSKGLRQISEVAHEVGKGHFDVYVPVPSGDELGQLAESVNNMAAQLKLTSGEKSQAQMANHQKSLFLANMSHEFRTPLAAIVGFSELLKDPHLSAEDRKTYTDIIHRTGQGLTTLINDVLDLSKVESGHLNIEKTDFCSATLLQDLEAMTQARVKDKNIQVVFNERGPLPERMFTDPVRLRQILMNVLGNAIKFTDQGVVEFNYCGKNGFLNVEINDTGVGISAEKIDHLFENFSTGDNSVSRRHEGSGLGLVLSKKLSELLGGSVRLVKSSPGQGSTFAIQLPISTSVAIPKRVRHDLKAGNLLARKSILVVDDVEDNRLLMQRILTKKGAKLTLATNGEEGLSKALTEHYDIILMDIQMPIMDGYTATRRLRQAGYQKPIIALTAHAMKDDRERCLAAGCTDYLTKPVHVETLMETILNHSQGSVLSE